MSSWVHTNKNTNTRVRNAVTLVWGVLRLIPNKLVLPRLKGFPIDFNTLLNMSRAHKNGRLE